jgi:pimeloyl-ACP methyl ester carboxylesterase
MAKTMTIARRSPLRWLLLALAGAALLLALSSAPGAAARSGSRHPQSPKPTIVLVHGAWADASGWSGVIRRLQHDGYHVIAPANPLRSLSGDSAYLASILSQTPGPIVLVGHSYGGAVITNAAAGNPNVKALVYIDAFIPDVGEQVANLAGAGSQIPASVEVKAFPPFGPTDLDLYLRADAFRSTFAGDVSPGKAALMAAEQRPLSVLAGAEPTTAAAWKTIPSWALIGLDDHAITPDQQRFMAHRAGAATVEIHSSHAAMVSHPRAVARLIETAAEATG